MGLDFRDVRFHLFAFIHTHTHNTHILSVIILLCSPLFVGFRRWVQAVFRVSDSSNSSSCIEAEANHLDNDNANMEIKQNSLNGGLNDSAVDLSEGVAVDMFGVLPSNEYEVRFSPLLSHCWFS